MKGTISAETEKRMKNTASRFAFEWGQEAEDLLQDMYVHVIEKSETDPAFLDQTPAYVAQSAIWSIRSDSRKAQNRAERNTMTLTWEDDEEGESEIAEDGRYGSLEMAAEEMEIAELVKSLPDTLRGLAVLLAQGCTKAEAARLLKLSPQLVNHRVKLLRRQMAPVYGIA